MAEHDLNGDLSLRVHVDTAAMTWSPSPSPKVWRKRVHRVGPAESGQVTSVVRYDAESNFPAHEHPDGEEILVLEGTFSDDRGDWPPGTYLLNPEGYSHAPSSRDGCVLFVKLRQYPGTDRQQAAIDTNALAWQTGPIDGIEVKRLYSQPDFADAMTLERWAAGTAPGQCNYPEGVEFFVVDGELHDESGQYGTGSWLRLPAGGCHSPVSSSGCVLYCKRGGHRYLRKNDSENVLIP